MHDFVSELKGTLVLPSLLYCSRAKPIIHEPRHGLFAFLIDYLENTKKYITDEQKAFVRKNIFNLKD